MGVDLRSNAIDTSHALRTSGRATRFTVDFKLPLALVLLCTPCRDERHGVPFYIWESQMYAKRTTIRGPQSFPHSASFGLLHG